MHDRRRAELQITRHGKTIYVSFFLTTPTHMRATYANSAYKKRKIDETRRLVYAIGWNYSHKEYSVESSFGLTRNLLCA